MINYGYIPIILLEPTYSLASFLALAFFSSIRGKLEAKAA
jgi:hypothetical protein